MRLWSFLTVLVLATGLGVIVHQDPGYALFSFGDWTMEMPLWVALILFVLSIAVLLFILWVIQVVFTSKTKVKQWWKNRQEQRARLLTYRGLLALAEGRW